MTEESIQAIQRQIEPLLKGLDAALLSDMARKLTPGIDWSRSRRGNVLDGLARWILTGEVHSSSRHKDLSVEERWDLFYREAINAFYAYQTKLEDKAEALNARISKLQGLRDSK